jgi:predicted nucleotidyltransferase
MGDEEYPTLWLSRRLGATWPNIEAARTLARQRMGQLTDEFRDFDSEDTSVVVLGSLAREEFTQKSDIDWLLLADGIADPNHQALLLDAKDRIKRIAAKEVGREGTFEGFVSSHDLIHRIGGEEDTNRNLTRRLLLILESAPVGRSVAHPRVVKNILKRYLMDDRSFWKGTRGGHHIPHFLLNDLARFWRTMAVDFAYKLYARGGDGWAIRNIKLRMSRKLLYVKGLLVCFWFHTYFPDPTACDEMLLVEELRMDVLDIVNANLSQTPLDTLASFLHGREHLSKTASQLFGAYDDFLGILADKDSRAHLEKLPEEEADSDATYQLARKISHRFRDALLELFFDDKTELGKLTRMYGVF